MCQSYKEFVDSKYDFVKGFKPINKSERFELNLVLDGTSSKVSGITNEFLNIIGELEKKGVQGIELNDNVLVIKQSKNVEKIVGGAVAVSYKGEQLFTYHPSLGRLDVTKNFDNTFDIVLEGERLEVYIKQRENGIAYKKLIGRTYIAFNETTSMAISRLINTDRYWLYW